jgi:hypothetical protein
MCTCEIDWNAVAEFSKSMLTPTIGAVTVYIAWQQWKTNQQKLDFDRYDRRLKIYDELLNFIAVALDSKVTSKNLTDFHKTISDANFIFGDDIIEYLNEVYGHCSKLFVMQEQYKSETQPNTSELANDMYIESSWLASQQDKTKETFKNAFNVHK